MSKLETQYKNYLKDNPDSNYTYDEWVDNVLTPILEMCRDDQEDMLIWDVTLLDGLEDDRLIDFKETINKISEHLNNLKYYNGDISDIGNEIGYAIGSVLENMTEYEINSFVTGFKHGVSLKNGTHN
jgi:hypothetical protein